MGDPCLYFTASLVAAGKGAAWDKLVAGFTKPVPRSEVLPDKRHGKVYDQLLEKYAGCELDAIDAL